MKKTKSWIMALLVFFNFYEDSSLMGMGGGFFGRKTPGPSLSSMGPDSGMPVRAKRSQKKPPRVSQAPSPNELDQSEQINQTDQVNDIKNSQGDSQMLDPGMESSSVNQEGGDASLSNDPPPPSEPIIAVDTDPAKIQAMNPFQKTRLDTMRCLCEEAMFYAKRAEVNIKVAPPGVTLEQEKKYARENYSNSMTLISTMLGDTQELTSAIEHMNNQKEDADLFKPDFCSIPKKDPSAAPGADWNYQIHGEWKDKDEKGMNRSLGWKSKISLYARCISLSISGRNCAKHPKEKCSKGVVSSIANSASSFKDKIMGKKNGSKPKKKKKKKSPLGGIAGVAGGVASMTPAGMAVNMATGGALSGGGTPRSGPAPRRRSSMF